jgi:competence protein ComEC
MDIFCFFIGILFVLTGNGFVLLAAVFILFITPKYPIVLLLLLGMGWAWLHQSFIAPKGMPPTEIIPRALIQGTVVSIPVKTPYKTQFIVSLEQLNHKPATGLIQLAWYRNIPAIHSGQRWQFSVTLKKPRNFYNLGSDDYVRTLASRHVFWIGYVREQHNKQLNPNTSFRWNTLREYLNQRLISIAPDIRTTGMLEALTLNTTTHITQSQWDLFRRTGTTHLFGISGEHIALISGLIFIIFRRIWSQAQRCCQWFPATYVASIGGFIAALLYSFLAGFAPPVQRALMGCFFYMLSCLGLSRIGSWQSWRYALFIVLCIEPHAVFMQGFYFSFIAVACLLLTQQRWQLKGYQAKLALQLSCLLGLMPLTLFWYSYGSINGLIANLFAIPLVGLLIMPLALLCLICHATSFVWILVKPLSWLTLLLYLGLEWTEHLESLNISWAITQSAYALSLMGALLLWVLLPIKSLKPIVLLGLLLPLFPSHSQIKHGEAFIDVLDVGQGLAASIRTQHHTLLYDTGDRFFQGSDMGKMVVLPFYRALGIKKLDAIVISHPDRDHLGGLKSIEEVLPNHQLFVNDPNYYRRGLSCHHGQEWDWDGVHFRFFAINTPFESKNNTSCILQVSNGKGTVLFPGDIEQVAEDDLTIHYGAELASDVLILPHHGSKTSSSLRFLLEVAPHFAIASLGFNNRFHFPHSKTLNSLDTLGINFYRTDQCGQTEIILSQSGAIQKPSCFHSSTE